MAKRFIDTTIFRKEFIKGLEPAYKLLWFYIINECDHAGIWDVEIEVAEIRLGVKFKDDPLQKFAGKVVVINGGGKWFIPSFVDFQYGVLNPENRAHSSVISQLRKYNLLDDNNQIKPLISPLQGAMDKDMVMDLDKDMDKVKEKEPPKKSKNDEAAIRVLEYYRTATGRNIDTSNPAWVRLVAKQIKAGAQESDLCDVVDYKIAEWKGTEWEKHLVPKTIFGDRHCADYLLQAQNAREQGLTAQQIRGKGKGKTFLDPMQVMREVYQYHESKNQ